VRAPQRFNPADPLGRRTLYEILATGAGQAHPTRLAAAAGGGLAGAIAIALLVPRWWPAAMPFVCVGAFGAWGLASQKLDELDLKHEPAGRLRLILRASRTAVAVVGTIAGLVGVTVLFLIALGPSWSH
jgi:hypothetical protein